MWQPIEGYRELGIVGGSLVEYWDGESGLLADARLIVGGKEFTLPGLLCEKLPDPQPEPLDRIAAALERIAERLEALTSAAGNLKVEQP